MNDESTASAHAQPPSERVDIRDLRAFCIDMDGVLYRGDAALPGAREFVEFLRIRGIPHLFLTNNSTRTPKQYVEKLFEMGIRTQPEHILTSALVAVAALAREAKPQDRILLLGSGGIREQLAIANLTLADHYGEATYVLAGLDPHVTYEKLAQVSLAIQRGARFWATNGDRSFPTERGLEPGAGALLAAITATTGVSPRLFGKPEPEMFEQALAILGTPPELTGMIGDRYETDIVGGRQMGLVTLAVATGVSSLEDLLRRTPPPDHVFPSVVELRAALDA
jgi:HAD superfamily hydrolase (TIGR01457 family)